MNVVLDHLVYASEVALNLFGIIQDTYVKSVIVMNPDTQLFSISWMPPDKRDKLPTTQKTDKNASGEQ